MAKQSLKGLDPVRQKDLIHKMKTWTSEDYKKAEDAFLEMMGESSKKY